MTILKEGIHNVDFIAKIEDPILSVDEGNVLNASTTDEIVSGTVLAASGTNFVAMAAGDTPVGILYESVPANSPTGLHRAIVARQAAVIAAHLTWPAGITPAQQDAATAALLALTIVQR